MRFTFLTITYNHQKFIIQHLESIKYQILNYGQEFDIQLVIADDYSKDSTINLINLWLEDNKTLFSEVKIIANSTNLGVCNNYCNGIKNISGDYFKVLAGDDLYSIENIFEVVRLLKLYDVVITPTGEFSGNKLYLDKKIYSRIYSMYKYVNTDYKKIVKFMVQMPMTPGIFIRKELITMDIIDFILKFRMVEDVPQNIKLYEGNKDLKIGLYEKVIILYRHHDKAITKTNDTNIVKIFKDDILELNKYILKHNRNFFLKLTILYRMFLNGIKNKRLALFLNFEVLFYRLSFVLSYYRIKSKIMHIIKNSFMPNEKHLENIASKASDYK